MPLAPLVANSHQQACAPGVSVPGYSLTTNWVKPITNFDNIGVAIWTLFQMGTLEMWSDIMYAGIEPQLYADIVGNSHKHDSNDDCGLVQSTAIWAFMLFCLVTVCFELSTNLLTTQ